MTRWIDYLIVAVLGAAIALWLYRLIRSRGAAVAARFSPHTAQEAS